MMESNWTEEQNVEEQYVNVYIPCSVQNRFGHVESLLKIRPEAIQWLYDNVGIRQAFGIEWYNCLNDDSFDWSVRGVVNLKDFPHYQVMIKDKKKALMFKLAFGGY